MAKYHFNPNTGVASECKAKSGGCPFASDEEHSKSLGEAQQAAEKFMNKQYATINSVYKNKGSDPKGRLDKMSSKLKTQLIKDSVSGKNKLHPSVVGKVLSQDKDESVRAAVAKNIKSQNLIRKMSDDNSAKVKAQIAASTKNPAVLKKLANDPDPKVSKVALKNQGMPKKAKKETLSRLKKIQKK